MDHIPDSERTGPSPRPEFRTTHWSVVLAARLADAPEANQALEQLCATYWYPLYAFVRRSGRNPFDAEDLVQEFFARMLGRQYLGLADPAKGRFRTFLLCALKRFLADDWDRRQAQKRGGGIRPISLDEGEAEARYRCEPADPVTPETLYERQWAQSFLAEVLRRLRDEHARAGKADQFDTLKVFIAGDKAARPMAEAARRLGVTEPALKAIVHRLRRRYGELVREVIADTVQDPRDVEDEIRHLLAVLQGG